MESGNHRLLGLTVRLHRAGEIVFPDEFLDGLIDLPTSIYWRNGSAEETGGQPRFLVLMKARESFLPG